VLPPVASCVSTIREVLVVALGPTNRVQLMARNQALVGEVYAIKLEIVLFMLFMLFKLGAAPFHQWVI